MSTSLQPQGLQHTRPPRPSLSPRVCSNSCPLRQKIINWLHNAFSFTKLIPLFLLNPSHSQPLKSAPRSDREGVKAFTQLLWRGKYWVLIDVILDKRSVFAAISTRYIVWWTVVRQAPLSMGIFQARLLEWVAISFSRESSQPRDWTHVPWILLYWQAGFFFFTTNTTWEDQQSIELKLYTCMWEMGVQPTQIASGLYHGKWGILDVRKMHLSG